MVHHLDELLSHAKIPPAVNQIELHPWCQQRDVVAFCEAHGIAVVAYSPLTKGMKLGDRRLSIVASEVRSTPAQVLLRWSLQRRFVAIPKSVKRERIIENAAIFEFSLTTEHMATLDRLVHSSVISMLLRLAENSKRTLRPFIPPRSLIMSK